MDFALSPAQREFRRDLQDWLEANLPAGWLDGDRSVPEDDAERKRFLSEWQRTLYTGDWAGVHWPREYGGRGASLVEETIYREEMARYDTPPRVNRLALDYIGPTLMERGTDRQKERFLPKMLSGEEIWCQGYSEPGAGSDVASLTTAATYRDGEFVINGEKVWTSFAHLADWCFLVTRTDDSGTKHEGLTTLLVDMDQEGVSTSPIRQANDQAEFNRVYFDDAITPEANVVGEVDEGWSVVRTLSSFEHATTRIFEIERRFRNVLEWCRTTTRDGTVLAEHPTVRTQLADLASRIHAAKVSHYRQVTERMETGTPGPEGSMEQVVGDEIDIDLGNFAMNVLGPAAALWEDGHEGGQWAENYLSTYGYWIGGGTGDIQRNIIAEGALGLPADDKSKTSHRE